MTYNNSWSSRYSHLDSEDKGDPLVILTDDNLVRGFIRLGVDDTSHVILNIIIITLFLSRLKAT